MILNDYPESFINTQINSRLRKIKFNKQRLENTSDTQPKTTIAIPLRNNFYKKCSNILSKYNIRTTPLINNKLNNIIRLGKEKLEKMDTCGVVYKIDCMSCQATYIGETKRSLKTRINEHKKDLGKKSVVAARVKKLVWHWSGRGLAKLVWLKYDFSLATATMPDL